MKAASRGVSPQLLAVLEAVGRVTGEGAVVDGRDYRCICPVHGGHGLLVADGDRGVLLDCRAGCTSEAVVSSLGLGVKDLFYDAGVRQGDDLRPATRVHGLVQKFRRTPFERVTMTALSTKCGVPADFLARLGWREGDFICTSRKGSRYGVHGVAIPYWIGRVGGQVQTVKIRVGVSEGHEGAKYVSQVAGVRAGPYGVWALGYWRRRFGYLFVVEGETDYASLALHSVPPFALPGADTVGLLTDEHLHGFSQLWVIREPDAGGDNLVGKLRSHLRDVGWRGDCRVVRMPPGTKDPCALLRDDPKRFPERFSAACRTALPIDSATKRYLVCAKDVVVTPVRFLFAPYFVHGVLNAVYGMPDVGKTYLLMAIAAKLTRGEVFPGCDAGNSDLGNGHVVFVGREDAFEQVLAPRFLACGGDPAKMHFFDFEGSNFDFSPGNLPKVEEMYYEAGRPPLMAFDPISKMFPPGTNTNDENAVAQALVPVAQAAQRLGTTMVVLGHPPKNVGGTAQSLVAGSVQIFGTIRGGVGVVKDPGDADPGHHRAVCAPLKGNYGPKGKAFRYEISPEPALEDYPWVGSFTWGEASDETLGDLLTQGAMPGTDPRQLEEAVAFLREKVPAGETRKATEVQRSAAQRMALYLLFQAVKKGKYKQWENERGELMYTAPVAEGSEKGW